MDKFANQTMIGRTRNVYIFYLIIFAMLLGFLIGEKLIETFILKSPVPFFEHMIPSSLLYGIFLVFTYFYARRTNTSFYDMGFHGAYVPKSLFIGLLATSGYLLAVAIFQMSLNYPSVVDISILLLFTLLIGFTEETLFRGYIQANFQKEISQMKTVVFTGILFAFLHIPSYLISGSYLNLLSIPSLILIGLILGFIRIHTGNIWGVIIAHATWDFYQFLFTPEIPLNPDLMDLIPILVASGCMWGTIVLSMILAKHWIERPRQMPEELIREYSLKMENSMEQIWRLQRAISVLEMRGFPMRRKIDRYNIMIRTTEESIEILKELIPKINELTYKQIRKLLPLKMKWVKIKNLLSLSGTPARLAILQSTLDILEAQIATIEREFSSAKFSSPLEDLKEFK